MKKLKKVIRILSTLLVFTILTTVIGHQQVFAQDAKLDKINIQYSEFNGNKYKFEQVKTDDNKYKTKVYTNGKLTDNITCDFDSGKIIDNDKEVGYVHEVLEEVPTTSIDAAKIAAGSMVVVPNVIDTDGGGGIKVYLKSYTTTWSVVTYVVVEATILTLATKAFAYLGSLMGKSSWGVQVLQYISTLLTCALPFLLPNKTYYVKVYNTGTVTSSGVTYQRLLAEYYSSSSYYYTTYEGCGWSQCRMR